MSDKPSGLQINQDLRYQHCEWRFQRFGRVAMLLIVLGALFGLMGVEAGPDRQTFVFRVPDPAQPTPLIFHFEPDERGLLPGRLGIEGAAEVAFWQLVYP